MTAFAVLLRSAGGLLTERSDYFSSGATHSELHTRLFNQRLRSETTNNSVPRDDASNPRQIPFLRYYRVLGPLDVVVREGRSKERLGARAGLLQEAIKRMAFDRGDAASCRVGQSRNESRRSSPYVR